MCLISVFASLVGIFVDITSSVIELNFFAITAWIKKYKSIIKKKKHDKIVLLAKAKLNSVDVIISRALINSNITHDELVSINNVLEEYNDITKEIRSLEADTINQRF